MAAEPVTQKHTSIRCASLHGTLTTVKICQSTQRNSFGFRATMLQPCMDTVSKVGTESKLVKGHALIPKIAQSVLLTTFTTAAFLCITMAISIAATAQAPYVPFEGEKSAWHDGFDRFDYMLDCASATITPFKRPENEGFGIGGPPAGSRRCVVICPKHPAPGNPWCWRGCYWDHQPQTEVELLRRGFHIAYISADATTRPDKEWDVWYEYLTGKHGLSPKPAFVGMSRGGEFALTWATSHPDKVTAIYADNPGGNDEMMRRLPDMARADVPLMLVCGSIDPILNRFALPIESIYQQYGGRVSVMIKDGAGHHPHSLQDPTPLADFIENSFKEAVPAKPEFVGENKYVRSTYLSAEEKYQSFPKDGYNITLRGPVFLPHYQRYDVTLGFATPITMICPNAPASGQPWVLRAGYVPRDAVVDQALLAKGYHIVVAPIGFNADGPDYNEWAKLYTYLVGHGFSAKPVMEGSGGAAAAVYGWAILNPDKVSRIYAENALMHAPYLKRSPLDNLAPLAKAGVKILHVCSRPDAFVISETTEAKQRYTALNGFILTFIIPQRGGAHSNALQGDITNIVDLIVSDH